MYPSVADLARRYGLAAIPICVAAAFWCVHPNIIYDVDSQGYLDGWPARTATYHLFLRVFSGPVLLPVQLLLLSVALSWLALRIAKYLPWSVAGALTLGIALNPFLWELQATILSEALTVPILVFIVGLIVGFAVEKRPLTLITVGALCGIATTIRPSLLPMVLAPLSIIWVSNGVPRKLRLSSMVAAAWFAPVAAERLYWHAVHGPEVTSYLGRQTFLKSALIEAPVPKHAPVDQLDRRLTYGIVYEFEPVRRLVKQAPSRNIRYILLSNYEACAGYPYASRLVAPFRLTEAEIERHLLRVGLERLRQNPIQYLQISATDYHRMWLLHPRKHPELAADYNEYLKHASPLPFDDLLGELARPTPPSEQQPIMRLNRAAFALVGFVAGALTILFVLWRANRICQIALSLLAATEAVLVFSALLGVGLPRYAMGMWPTLVAGELLGFVGLLSLWKPKVVLLREKP